MTRRYRSLGWITIGALVATSVAVWSQHRPNASANGLDASSATGLSPSLAAIGANTEFVRTEKTYRRYGPAAMLIEGAGNGPEYQTTILRASFNSEGEMAEFTSTTTDINGTLLQETRSDHDSFETRNAVSGDTKSFPSSETLTAAVFKERAADANANRARLLANNDARVVGRGGGVIVVEVPAELPSIRTSTGEPASTDAYTIPWVADLGAVGALTVATLEADSLTPLKLETFAVTRDGTRILIESREIISSETRPWTPASGAAR